MIGKYVEVNGRRVHVVFRAGPSGLVSRPTFVIEAACGWFSAMYAWMIPVLEQHGSVLAYDRAGLGYSTPSHAVPDAVGRAQELKELLLAMGLQGPCVLIGHSIGALYLRVFAHQNRDSVLGLVFLDSTHTLVYRLLKGRTPWGERVRYRLACWASRLKVRRLPYALLHVSEAPWHTLPPHAQEEIADVAANPCLAVTELAERASLEQASQQAEVQGMPREIPLLVVTAGIRTARELRYSGAPNLFMPQWMLFQRDLLSLSNRSRQRIIAGAGHCDLVTDQQYALQVCAAIVEFTNALTQSGPENRVCVTR